MNGVAVCKCDLSTSAFLPTGIRDDAHARTSTPRRHRGNGHATATAASVCAAVATDVAGGAVCAWIERAASPSARCIAASSTSTTSDAAVAAVASACASSSAARPLQRGSRYGV